MKKAYYIITAIISLLLSLLFIIPIFPLSELSLSSFVLVLLFLSMSISSVFGIVKNCPVKLIFRLKISLGLIGFGGFLLAVALVYKNIYYVILFIIFTLSGFMLALDTVRDISDLLKAEAEEKKVTAERKVPLDHSFMVKNDPSETEKIWQYEINGKPRLTPAQSRKKNILLACSIPGAILGFVLPFVIGASIGMDEIFGEFPGHLFTLIAIVSILVFAVTLGFYKPHNTQNIAFVKRKDGSVFLVDYFDPLTARDFGYAGMIPNAGTHVTLFSVFAFSTQMNNCITHIRKAGIDKSIAARCEKYGHQIITVPEICRCGYYTNMIFTLWNGVAEYRYSSTFNLYDNCYEGYDEMIEYFENSFDHNYDESYQRETGRIRAMKNTGMVLLILGFIAWLSGALTEINLLLVIGIFVMVAGSSMFLAGIDALSRRKNT
ncbi:MAG: hypothetical protein ILP17_11700 [Lachnospiraceae bacterium]|nr:hypothetical protein [Lachnospiraceae bacterium]